MANASRQDGEWTGRGPEDFRQYCRDIPDFPKKGVVFKDITTLLKNGAVFKRAIDEIARYFEFQSIDVIASVDARGFIIGAALAYKLGCGVVPVRKKGKLPWLVNSQTYDLEYGQDVLEIHRDAIEPGQKVLIVDDVLATGGTASAVVSLVQKMKGEIIGAAFLLELKDLKGRDKLPGIQVYSLIEC
ncbi:MAG: adenine phosphoribosyltransferase [Chloroflexi bacterium]|jgi:adenine phosphoribosyltransferase|nr:adenine phosphoribosyltransferase [Chloroflexota bacterium]